MDRTGLAYGLEALGAENVSELETPGGGDCYLQDTEYNLVRWVTFQDCSHILMLTPPLSVKCKFSKH